LVKVRLRPLVSKLNMPTVIKTTVMPGDSVESLVIATQVGEIFYISGDTLKVFLDIRPRVLKLGVLGGGYDERGLIGLAFHPEFQFNGLFYLHYTLAGTQGLGPQPHPTTSSSDVLPEFFKPDPCNPETQNLKWTNRETQYDHIDTVEEWIYHPGGEAQRRRTLLNIRRPFFNHNGVNSLNFSPETRRLVLTTGDGGSGYDPFNLSQNNMEIAGKIIEIDVDRGVFTDNPPAVTRFDELPPAVLETLTVVAKGVRNITGFSYQWLQDHYVKYAGIVGQDLVESVFSFVDYKPVPVPQLLQKPTQGLDREGFINFGWRGWEGAFPTAFENDCTNNPALSEKVIAYDDEAIRLASLRTPPLTCYYHHDPRPDKFNGMALTAVQPYMGSAIPELAGGVLFTDFARNEGVPPPARGVLAFSRLSPDCRLSDYEIIETDDDFGTQSAYYVSLGSNMNQTSLYLGVYGSMNTADPNLGTVFEILP
jgi:hypothetical protein